MNKLTIDHRPLSTNRAYSTTTTGGRPYVYETGEMQSFKKYVSDLFNVESPGDLPTPKPVDLSLTFFFDRQHQSNENLRGFPYPDVDGPVKPTLDALEGVLFEDDTQVIKLFVSKLYEEEARIVVRWGIGE